MTRHNPLDQMETEVLVVHRRQVKHDLLHYFGDNIIFKKKCMSVKMIDPRGIEEKGQGAIMQFRYFGKMSTIAICLEKMKGSPSSVMMSPKPCGRLLPEFC